MGAIFSKLQFTLKKCLFEINNGSTLLDPSLVQVQTFLSALFMQMLLAFLHAPSTSNPSHGYLSSLETSQAHTIEIVKTLESSHAQTHFNSKNLPKLFDQDFKKLASIELSHETSKGFPHLNFHTQSVHPQNISCTQHSHTLQSSMCLNNLN